MDKTYAKAIENAICKKPPKGDGVLNTLRTALPMPWSRNSDNSGTSPIAIYLALLFGGVGLLVLSYVAQFRLANLLRQRYPQQWKIVAEPEHGRPSPWRTWVRLQHVLRSPALPALGDQAIDRWQADLARQPVARLAVLAGGPGHAAVAA